MESRAKTNDTKSPSKMAEQSEDVPDHKESEDEESPTPAASRLTRLRTAAVALASARRNSATAAARRSIAKAKTSAANRTITGRDLPSQRAVRRSSRVTRGSKKIEAEEQAAEEEVEKQKNELEDIKKKLQEPYIMESATCQYNYTIYELSDIISIRGAHDGNLYYAKIIAFFTNKFAERSVAVRWLIPKYPMSHPIWKKTKQFNMSLYNEGPRDDKLIPMENITFVDRIPLQIDQLGEPFLLHKGNRTINVLVDKPLSSMV